MPLSWNEIRDRSLAFSREWAEECSEDAEAKSFWDGSEIPASCRHNGCQLPSRALKAKRPAILVNVGYAVE